MPMYVCTECGYESAKPGKHCDKPMAEKAEEKGFEEEMEEEMEEESMDDE